MLGLTQYTSGGSTWASGRSWLKAEAHQHTFQRKLWKYIVGMCVCQGSSASQRLCALHVQLLPWLPSTHTRRSNKKRIFSVSLSVVRGRLRERSRRSSTTIRSTDSNQARPTSALCIFSEDREISLPRRKTKRLVFNTLAFHILPGPCLRALRCFAFYFSQLPRGPQADEACSATISPGPNMPQGPQATGALGALGTAEIFQPSCSRTTSCPPWGEEKKENNGINYQWKQSADSSGSSSLTVRPAPKGPVYTDANQAACSCREFQHKQGQERLCLQSEGKSFPVEIAPWWHGPFTFLDQRKKVAPRHYLVTLASVFIAAAWGRAALGISSGRKHNSALCSFPLLAQRENLW